MQIIQTAKTTPRPCKIMCLGDSQTRAYTNGIQAKEYWASRLQIRATAQGYSTRTINIGNSGYTTTQLEALLPSRLSRFNPDVLIIYAGVNDGGAGATTQAKIQAMIDDALAPANNTNVKFVLVMNTNYLNYSINGDPGYLPYATLRTFQLAAANYGVTTYGANKVGYADLYSFQAALIANGIWTQGTWQNSQIADSDQHMNANAHDYTAQFVLSQLIGGAAGNVLLPYQIK